MKKYLYLSFCFIFTALLTFLCTSCEYDADGENYHHLEPLPSEIGVAINLADVNPEETIYIYGPTSFYIQVNQEKGRLHFIEINYNGEAVTHQESPAYFYVDPDATDAGQLKNLNITVAIDAGDKSLAGTLAEYSHITTASYKIMYVRIMPEDFEIKSLEVDRIIYQMTRKNSNPCKYVMDGQEITDLDNIVYERNDYPYGGKLKIYLLPQHAPTNNYENYNYIELSFRDKQWELHGSASVDHFMDKAHEELYVQSSRGLSIHDKNMNILSQKNIETTNIAVTPVTGLIACSNSTTIKTYKDKSFSTVLSTIRNMYSRFFVTERDQLIQSHNFQVDVHDLHTGKLIYTIELSDYVYSSSVSADGKYLLVRGNSMNYVYLLNDDSASLVYSFEKSSNSHHFHPVNTNHVVFDHYKGFEIFDIETQQVVYSNKGRFQCIDPITGNLLFYDENYGYSNRNYQNRIIDSSYNEIFVFDNTTQSLYGNFNLFNNYLIKNTNYIDISSKLTKL